MFEQIADYHQRGKGCPSCGYIKVLERNKGLGLNEFIKRSKLKHGNKYDYSKVEYKTANNNVIIICPIHGEFKQNAYYHYNGGGCRCCSMINSYNKNIAKPTSWGCSSWEQQALKSKNFDSFKVYIIMCWNDDELFFKIGRTFTSIVRRFRSYSMPYNYSIIEEYVFETAKAAFDKENKLKRINKNNKYIPYIKFNGKQECFNKVISTE